MNSVKFYKVVQQMDNGVLINKIVMNTNFKINATLD